MSKNTLASLKNGSKPLLTGTILPLFEYPIEYPFEYPMLKKGFRRLAGPGGGWSRYIVTRDELHKTKKSPRLRALWYYFVLFGMAMVISGARAVLNRIGNGIKTVIKGT